MTRPPAHALVTGGAGFIGSHLVEHLVASGAEVTVIDDLSTGSLDNLDGAHDRVRFVRARLPDGLDAVPRDVTHVFHLAAAVGVAKVVDAPIESIEANIGPTAEILRWASGRAEAPIVLVASSSEVYGKSEALPFREDGDCLLGPTTSMRWSYAASKAIDEYLALAHHAQHGLRTVVVRLFNTVGPRQTGRYGMVLPRFVRAAVADEALCVFGDGGQTRCFCDVRDVAPAMARLAETEAAWGRVVNLGSEREVSIKALAKRVIELTESRSAMRFVPYSEAYGEGFEDPPARRPDLSRVRALIGFEPRIGLERTIRDLAAAQERAAGVSGDASV